jgi:hypothetical protein
MLPPGTSLRRNDLAADGGNGKRISVNWNALDIKLSRVYSSANWKRQEAKSWNLQRSMKGAIFLHLEKLPCSKMVTVYCI